MKLLIPKIKIVHFAHVVALCCLMSCSYLDVIPPAQPEYEDTMKDKPAVEDFLYTCYAGILDSNPFDFRAFEYSTDEVVSPRSYETYSQQVAWGIIAPSFHNSWGGDNLSIWIPNYNYIGYTHEFLNLIDLLEPAGVTEEDKKIYKAEAWFLEAYYHFRLLQAFGPIAIVPEKVDQNILAEDMPGRSHFDYCVDFIVNKLDEAAAILPDKQATSYLGRASSTICKALKARVLLYAASPLWNGSFPYPNWKNTTYETPGYGTELVSPNYDRTKWERALKACQEALQAAETAGYKLFDISDANSLASIQQVDLPYIPGKEDDTDENRTFKERVRMFQYLSTANEGDGNNELIWGARIHIDENNKGDAVYSRIPYFVGRKFDGSKQSGWGSLAPTLYAVQHFYTENGKIPALDNNFWNEPDWYTRFEDNSDIIKLNTGREARFYAWITFDGAMYSPKISNGQPLWMDFKDPDTNGWSQDKERDCVGTGYLSKKFIDPNMVFWDSGSTTWNAVRRPLIRLAELYLNLAECYAALDNQSEALSNLNMIRNRAGFNNLTAADITADMSLTDWIRNERFVELYEEGHRYYDTRRWAIALEQFKAGARYGLNGLILQPSFEEFNKPVLIDQPFRWENKLYLLPVWSRSDLDELYSNPNMVQAPGY